MTTDQTITVPVLLAGSAKPVEITVDLADLRITRRPGSDLLWLTHPETSAVVSHVTIDSCVHMLAKDVARLWQERSQAERWTVRPRPAAAEPDTRPAWATLPGATGNYLPAPPTIYVASKSCHAPRWRILRAVGAPIISTWIDEADEGATADWADLWTRCVTEAARASHVLAYHEPGETWKGAFVEIGAALANDATVVVVGDPPGSWTNHPQVRQAPDLITALGEILAEGDRRKAGHA